MMDAKEFVREWTRMCKKYGDVCEGCPLFRETGDPCLLPYCFSEVVVDVVQKWSAEHPLVTNGSEMMRSLPVEAIVDDERMDEVTIRVPRKWWDAEWKEGK